MATKPRDDIYKRLLKRQSSNHPSPIVETEERINKGIIIFSLVVVLISIFYAYDGYKYFKSVERFIVKRPATENTQITDKSVVTAMSLVNIEDKRSIISKLTITQLIEIIETEDPKDGADDEVLIQTFQELDKRGYHRQTYSREIGPLQKLELYEWKTYDRLISALHKLHTNGNRLYNFHIMDFIDLPVLPSE